MIFAPSGEFGWMNTHAQVPVALEMNNKIRIYFGTRKVNNESKFAYMDVDINDPSKILYIHDKPIFEKNDKPGTFDEHGVIPAAAIKNTKSEILLYYTGWSRRTSIPYGNLTGLVISEDGINFERKWHGPVLTTKWNEPFSCTSPDLIYENGKYYMFYCAGTDWVKKDGDLSHTYDVKLAISDDGLNWIQDGITRVAQADKYEAITRPTVTKINNTYHMLFCYRGSNDFRDGLNSYKIGYASSQDLLNWERDDSKAGITMSEEGWDSKMICYPYFLKTESNVFLFYNGNYFGKGGCGYAVLNSI